MGLNTLLLDTDEAKTIKLFKKMKTGVHMTGSDKAKVILFIDRTPLGIDEAKAVHLFE
jgi:hypothetical protein